MFIFVIKASATSKVQSFEGWADNVKVKVELKADLRSL